MAAETPQSRVGSAQASGNCGAISPKSPIRRWGDQWFRLRELRSQRGRRRRPPTAQRQQTVRVSSGSSSSVQSL